MDACVTTVQDACMGTASSGLRGSIRPAAAWALVAIDALAVLVGATVMANTDFEVAFFLGAAPGSVALAAVGALVVTSKPHTRIGWLLLASAISLALIVTGRQAAWLVYVDLGGDLGLAQWLIAIADFGFFILMLTLLLIFLTFPDGRLPSPRWRPVVALLIVVTLVSVVFEVTFARMFIVDPAAFLVGTELVGQPGVTHETQALLRLFDVVGAILLLLMLLSIVALVVRLRRSDDDTRRRIKWVVYAALAWLVLVPISILQRASSPAGQVVQDLLGGLAFVLLAAGFGIALFRHRLWDIDVIVRRSLVYGALWLGIAGAYVAVAAGLGLAAGSRFPVELAILLTALATLVFQPARRWLERVADQRVFGRRDSPVEAVHGFGEMIDRAERPADVAEHLAAAAAAAGLAWAEVDVDGSPPARRGAPSREPTTIVPIGHGGTTFGELRCQPHPGRMLAGEEQTLLAALAAQAGLAISHARLASRIVHAHETERRRIERNIHDGAQQELVGLVAQLGLARSRVDGDSTTRDVLTGLHAEVQGILSNLRDLAQGIHPPVLSDGGIVEAVEDRCSRLPIQVTLAVAPALRGRRFPDDVEGALYFSAAEALTNVVKHSQADAVEVGLGLERDSVTVDVLDAGVGFEPTTTDQRGLGGLADRIRALGGTFDVRSRPGGGTHLTATLPVAPVPTRPS